MIGERERVSKRAVRNGRRAAARHRAYFARIQEDTRGGMVHGSAWSDQEIQTLLGSNLTLVEIANLLGRTYAACRKKRHKVLRQIDPAQSAGE